MGRRGDRVGLASGPKTKHLDIVSCQYLYKMSKKVFVSGWLDQPFVSKYWPGAVITISIEPDIEFNDRSGMSGSTRRKAIQLWQTDIPDGDPGGVVYNTESSTIY